MGRDQRGDWFGHGSSERDDGVRRLTAWAGVPCSGSGLRDALELAKSGPPGIRAVRDRLGEAFDDRLADQLALLVGDYARLLDSRQRRVLEQRVVTAGTRATLQTLADQLAVTIERVRQLESSATRSILDAAEHDIHTQLVLNAIRGHLGVACPRSAVLGLLNVSERTEAVIGSFGLQLVLWLAGPYRLDDDWLVRSMLPPVEAATMDRLQALTSEGPADLEECLSVLGDLGVLQSFREPWLRRVRTFRVIGDVVERWSGTLADKAEVVLNLVGEPLTVDEISSQIPDRHVRGTLVNYLGSRPPVRARAAGHLCFEPLGARAIQRCAGVDATRDFCRWRRASSQRTRSKAIRSIRRG